MERLKLALKSKMTPITPSSVKMDPYTGDITLMSKDDRIAFRIKILDGHTIEIDGGMCVKDKDVVYTEQLQIFPKSFTNFVVSKLRWEP